MVEQRNRRVSGTSLPITWLPGVLALVLLLVPVANAQTYSVIYNFTGGAGGALPEAGLTMDNNGDFYGTTACGGHGDCSTTGGTVYKLAHTSSGWIYHPLYSFSAYGTDGAIPMARVIPGPDGTLYGTTYLGGDLTCYILEGTGCGTVYNLRPPARRCATSICPWTETVLYTFEARADGAEPLGEVVFDQNGDFYGTSVTGGGWNWGTAYKMAHNSDGWHYDVLYHFQDEPDAGGPMSGFIFDAAGNLYGTSRWGGSYSIGTVYELSPSTDGGWTEQVLHSFNRYEGVYPQGGLIFDSAGNLYGAATENGPVGSSGSVFELSPNDGAWNVNILAGLPNQGYCCGGPRASLTMDSAGNLYGTALGDNVHGYIFELTPGILGWRFTILHQFTGGDDGDIPVSNVSIDSNGNLYGTASKGGAYGDGVIWEITP